MRNSAKDLAEKIDKRREFAESKLSRLEPIGSTSKILPPSGFRMTKRGSFFFNSASSLIQLVL